MTTSLMMSSAWFVGLLLDVSLKAILLAALAGAGMWLLRVRSTSVRHRVWTAVLVGMLIMPLLIAWTPTVSLPTWAYPDLRFREGQESAVVHEFAALTASTPVANEVPLLESTVVPPSVATVPTATSIERTSVPPTFVPSAANLTDRMSTLIVVCYAFGVALFGGRLLAGLVAAQRLVRTAEPIELPPHHAATIGTTRLVESPQVRVPLTVGWLRPTILLPSDWASWSDAMLAAVLAHEQAHVRRHDPWVALLAQANWAIYWFHPLAWFLAHRLTTLAEEACDDAVIESLGDRTAYARHLLAIASRLQSQPRRLQPIGVAMAARPAVENRIEAILDHRRPLARRVGWIGSLILLAAITPVALLAAGIKADKGNPHVDTAPPVALASDTGTLRLMVLDDNDAPVPNAGVRMRVRQVFMGADKFTKYKTDASGRLKFEVPRPTPYYLSAHVSTPGHAPFLAEWENHDTPDPIPAEYTVRLDRGRTIGGVVHDEAGKPIEGVKVSPQFNLALRPERTYQMGSGASVQTNARGEWTYESLPAELQQVQLTFTHASYIEERSTELVSKLAVADASVPSAVTMEQGLSFGGRVTDAAGKPIEGATVKYLKEGRYSSDSPSATTDSVGRYRFTSGEAGEGLIHVSSNGLAPAMRVAMVSRDMETIDIRLTAGRELQVRVVGPDQQPLDDAYVAFWNWDDQDVVGSIPGSRGKTDARGFWSWAHAPEGELRFAVSRKDFRYVPGEVLTPGAANLVVMTPETIEQKRMLGLSGRVIDAETAAPIARFRVTPGWERADGGRTYWQSESQSKGRDGAYRRNFAPNDLADDADVIVLRVEADDYAPEIVRTELSDADRYTADFALTKAASDSYEVLTPTGEQAAGAIVAIATPNLGPTIQDGMVADYSPCERAVSGADGRVSIAPQSGLFGLMVVHDSGAAYVQPGQLANSRTITLQPWARVEGTLRMQNQLAANEHVTLSLDEAYAANMPRVHFDYKTTTDANGEFAFERVVPGNGQVVRAAVSQLGGGMTRWTPTHVTNAKFPPGETTQVELGQPGRQIVGRLALPADVKPGNDWRLAMVSLQSRPKNVPARPKVPFPLGMERQKDQDAARIWWEQWSFTDEGKEFQQQMKRYQDAINGFKPNHFSGRVEPDGSFAFEDIPGGDYQISVQAYAASPRHAGISGDMIATLQHTFTVPDVDDGAASEPVDLGGLALVTFQ